MPNGLALESVKTVYEDWKSPPNCSFFSTKRLLILWFKLFKICGERHLEIESFSKLGLELFTKLPPNRRG